MNTTSTLPLGRIIKERYEILKVLGSGGMGAVYLAQDIKENKFVAIKEMHKITDHMERAKDIGLFGREAHFLTNLKHPNLPELYEFFLEEERPYLVMEYIEGKTLQEILDESPGPLEQEEVISWSLQLCEVLNYLHTQNPRPVIFRDLKLANIILDKEKKIKLIDFGIAREFNPRKNTDTIRMGSVGYAPPEQYAKGGQTDIRTDLYSLGVCIHTLLTKNDPSASPFNFQEVIAVNPVVSISLNKTVMKSLNIKPEKRFQSSPEMLEALKKEMPAPGIKITPDFIDLGEIETGESKTSTAVISNTRKELLSGKLKEPLPGGINLNFTEFQGNYQELIIEVKSSFLEAEKEYREKITFTTSGGDGEINLLFKIVLPKTNLGVSVTFLDFGTVKQEEDTGGEFIIYNTGAGLLEGKIYSHHDWMEINPPKFNSNEETIKVSVIPCKLPPDESVVQSSIIIESNGGRREINTLLFQPVPEISPSSINLGVLKKEKTIPLKIKNTGKGYMKGKIKCKDPWIKIPSEEFKGNHNIIDIKIDPSGLKKGVLHKSSIEFEVNRRNFSVPVTVKPSSPLKFLFKISFIFFLIIIFLLSSIIRDMIEEKTKNNLALRLVELNYLISYSESGKIFIIKPDGTEKKFITQGNHPQWSSDGKLLFFTSEKKFKFINYTGKVIALKGSSPKWSPDGKKILFEGEQGIIKLLELDKDKPVALIYGKNPSWSPDGEKFAYDDGNGPASSIKTISLKEIERPELLTNGFNPYWSPDGKNIVYNIDNKTMAIIDINTFEVNYVIEGYEPVWSSDGERLAFLKDNEIQILDLKKGEKKILIEGQSPSWSPDDQYIVFKSLDGISIIELSSEMIYELNGSGKIIGIINIYIILCKI